MIFITGPLYAGKESYICHKLGWTHEEFLKNGVRDVQILAAKEDDLEVLASALSEKQVVISTEIGGGVVPVEAEEREAREKAGRLQCMLAERAEIVIRVCCGLPQILKGSFSI